MFFKYSCENTLKKNVEDHIFRRVLGCNKFFKGFPAFNKVANSLRQVLQIYSLFLCTTKNVLQKQSVKINLKVPGKSCGKIDDDIDEIHIILNLGQE